MGDEHDRPALLLEREDPPEALSLERLVADGEDLVKQQDVGVEERRDREPEPHRHSRRVRADGPIDRVLELGERDDLVEAALDLGPRQTLDRAVQEDVLAPGEVHVKAGAELEQRADAPLGAMRPAVGLMIPAISRSSVVLPDPLRPMRPTASPCSTATETSRSAHTSVEAV